MICSPGAPPGPSSKSPGGPIVPRPTVLRLVALVASLVLVLATTPLTALGQGGRTTVVVLHTSDYHSHALPIYAEGERGIGGLAKVVQYMRDQKAANPNTVIFSGGDTMNMGIPSWSDKYQCAEWPLFNDLQDAMALGNHDEDYGWDTFQQCAASVKYPVIAANFVNASGEPILKPYVVIDRGGIKIGAFALDGSDFEKLVLPKNRPEGATFADGDSMAPEIIQKLRDVEHVDVVMLIGHRLYEEDIKTAQTVPGIDVILGTHSHRKEDLMKIPGTNTWYISPFQYFGYVSRVELAFEGKKLVDVTGGLVRMGPDLPEAPDVAAQVSKMEADLEADPQYAPRFVKLGSAAVELSDTNINTSESVLGNWVQETVRVAAGANLAVSTSSSFRAAIPPGDVTVEDYLTAVPYKNLVLVHEMTGAQVQQLLDLSAARKGTDSFSQESGARFTIKDGKAADVQILADPTASASDQSAFVPLDPAATYLVEATDFQAKIASGYSDLFKQAASVRDTGLIVNDVMMDSLRSSSPVSAALDGRIQ
jgi:5'-nucleotidase/UDP-sugar diphosphatase